MKNKWGQSIYEDFCPGCGVKKFRVKNRLGKKCSSCAKTGFVHGLRSHHLYKLWGHIKERCYKTLSKDYKNYGTRGIKVCDEWLNDPEAFINWAESNGYAKGLEIDRIDNNGNYSPENCRFVPREVNARNKRNTKCSKVKILEIRILFNGGFKVSEISKMMGVNYQTIYDVCKGATWKNV